MQWMSLQAGTENNPQIIEIMCVSINAQLAQPLDERSYYSKLFPQFQKQNFMIQIDICDVSLMMFDL